MTNDEIDCEQSPFFFRFVCGSVRARQRRAVRQLDARNYVGCHARVSCIFVSREFRLMD